MVLSVKSHQTTLIVAYVAERGVHVHSELKDSSNWVCVRWHEIRLGFLVILDDGLCDFSSNNHFLSVKESSGRCLQSSCPYHLTATADEISLIFLQTKHFLLLTSPLPFTLSIIFLKHLWIFSDTVFGTRHYPPPSGAHTRANPFYAQTPRPISTKTHVRCTHGYTCVAHSLICTHNSSSSSYYFSSFSIPMCNNEK